MSYVATRTLQCSACIILQTTSIIYSALTPLPSLETKFHCRGFTVPQKVVVDAFLQSMSTWLGDEHVPERVGGKVHPSHPMHHISQPIHLISQPVPNQIGAETCQGKCDSVRSFLAWAMRNFDGTLGPCGLPDDIVSVLSDITGIQCLCTHYMLLHF
jgi:hypothetical protein